ncbi:MAG: hypothetical protein ABIK68_13600 [bacterium]
MPQKKIYYGWTIVAVAFLIGITQAGVFQNVLSLLPFFPPGNRHPETGRNQRVIRFPPPRRLFGIRRAKANPGAPANPVDFTHTANPGRF